MFGRTIEVPTESHTQLDTDAVSYNNNMDVCVIYCSCKTPNDIVLPGVAFRNAQEG